MDAPFRLQDLEIWKMANELTDRSLDAADELEQHHFVRFAEQA